jgi:hypothetical protein
MANTFRQQLDNIMSEIGYADKIKGMTNKEVVAMIEKDVVNLSDIDDETPFEVAYYELKDIFYEKHWVDIETFIPTAQLKRLYCLLCYYKRANN